MKRVQGKNIYEYDCLTKSQKYEILKKLIQALQELHHTESAQPVNIHDVEDVFFNKTFDRLSQVENLIPFADKEFIKINGTFKYNIKSPYFWAFLNSHFVFPCFLFSFINAINEVFVSFVTLNASLIFVFTAISKESRITSNSTDKLPNAMQWNLFVD